MTNLSIFDNSSFGFILVVVIIIVICLICALVRKKLNIGTYTKEEESKMKSNLDLLLNTK